MLFFLLSEWNWASLSVMSSLLVSKSCIIFIISKTGKLTINLWFCFLRQSSEWLLICQENETQSYSLISSLSFLSLLSSSTDGELSEEERNSLSYCFFRLVSFLPVLLTFANSFKYVTSFSLNTFSCLDSFLLSTPLLGTQSLRKIWCSVCRKPFGWRIGHSCWPWTPIPLASAFPMFLSSFCLTSALFSVSCLCRPSATLNLSASLVVLGVRLFFLAWHLSVFCV